MLLNKNLNILTYFPSLLALQFLWRSFVSHFPMTEYSPDILLVLLCGKESNQFRALSVHLQQI
jgi:hypothetical protein